MRFSRQFPRIIGAAAFLAATACGGGGKGGHDQAPSQPPTTVPVAGQADDAAQKLLSTYCVKCHQGSSPSGGVTLDTVAHAKEHAQKAAGELEEGAMPPPNAKQPSGEEKATLLAWFKAQG